MDQILIEKFDINKIKDNCRILIVGKPSSGKTTLINDILYQRKENPCYNKVISEIEDINHYYTNKIKGIKIESEYKQENVDAFLKDQKVLIRRKTAQDALLVIDEFIYPKDWFKLNTTIDIFKNGRCHRISVLFSTQYPMSLGPQIRTSLDYIFILNTLKFGSDFKRLYEMFGCNFLSFEEFKTVINNYTQDHRCIVIDQKDGEIYWYKADLHPNFEMSNY